MHRTSKELFTVTHSPKRNLIQKISSFKELHPDQQTRERLFCSKQNDQASFNFKINKAINSTQISREMEQFYPLQWAEYYKLSAESIQKKILLRQLLCLLKELQLIHKKIINTQYFTQKIIDYNEQSQKENQSRLPKSYCVDGGLLFAFAQNQLFLPSQTNPLIKQYRKTKLNSFVHLIIKFIQLQKMLWELLRIFGQVFISVSDLEMRREIQFFKQNLKKFSSYPSYLHLYNDVSNDVHELIFIYKKFYNFFKLQYFSLERTLPKISLSQDLIHIFTIFQTL